MTLAVAAACAACGQAVAQRHDAKPHWSGYTPAPATPGTTASGQASAAPAAVTSHAAAVPAAPPVPGALHLPAAGTYHATADRGGSISDVTMKYAVGATSGGQTPVTVTISSADGGQLVNHYSWRPDGIYLVETDVDTGTQTYNCVFQAPVLQSPAALHTGSRWSSSGTCSTPPPNSVTTTLQLTASVAGAAWQTIGGVNVATWEVKGTLQTEIKGSYTGTTGLPTAYDIRSTSQLDDFFDPPAGLDVRDISTTVSTADGKTSTSTVDTKLTGLRPS